MPATTDAPAPALAAACADLAALGRNSRRLRVRLHARVYDRARHLPGLVDTCGDQPGRPFSRLIGTWLMDDATTTRLVLRMLGARLNRLLRVRDTRDVEARIDMYRIAICAEAQRLAQQRAREMFTRQGGETV